MKKLMLLMILLAFPVSALAGTTYTVSPKAVYYSYHEQVMDETGYLVGVNLDVAHTTPQKYFLGLEAEILKGQLRYDGGYSNGDSLRCDTNDILFQGTAAAGKEFAVASWRLTPYTGIKYRYWQNDIVATGGYLRRISQFYLPVGLNAQYDLTPDWKLTFKVEGSLLLFGEVRSDLSDVSSAYSDIKNNQKFSNAIGARVSTKLEKNLGTYSLGIAPYFEWYEAETSEKTETTVNNRRMWFIEPHNTTWMAGLACTVSF